MDDIDFLKWIADRLVNVYGESENVDFVQKLRTMTKPVQTAKKECCDCKLGFINCNGIACCCSHHQVETA